MSTSLRTSRPSWFVRNSWIPMALAAVLLTVIVGVTVDEALGIVFPSSSTRTLHTACDRVVERLLTTHDPIELERSRILMNTLDCSVSDRLSRWPASRTGGLVP